MVGSVNTDTSRPMVGAGAGHIGIYCLDIGNWSTKYGLKRVRVRVRYKGNF